MFLQRFIWLPRSYFKVWNLTFCTSRASSWLQIITACVRKDYYENTIAYRFSFDNEILKRVISVGVFRVLHAMNRVRDAKFWNDMYSRLTLKDLAKST